MKTSTNGLAALAQREGIRLKAYKDTVGVWTIGVGHTGRMSPPKVYQNQVITKAQALQYLANDLGPVELAVNDVASRSKVEVTQNMFDAMVSLCFNIGVNGFIGSSVASRLARGDKPGAGNAFLMWHKPQVLLKRRQSERKQFLS